ncbi:MAG: UbiA-like polyprenyltransferase [Methylocystaceae bacterium]
MKKLHDFLTLIDFSYTLFGLPFAYLGAFLALKSCPTLHQLGWITLAMIAARTAALCLNRMLDLPYDRENPRTANWILVNGSLRSAPLWLVVLLSMILLVWAASQLNHLCLILSPVAVILLWGYSYTKRFTWLCHIILGLVVGIGPVASWLAVTGVFDWRPGFLWLAVGLWIAGFDIMYACQDIDFDREHGLYSIPARFGESQALKISEFCHEMVIILFVVNGLVLKLGAWYYTGIAIAALVLIYEHLIVRPGQLKLVHSASFKFNRYVSLIIFVMTLIDLFF